MRQYTTFFPEKITNLVPIVIISGMELWLIGASNGVDICMGKASGLSQNADERVRQIAEKNQCSNRLTPTCQNTKRSLKHLF
ncbi:hypothetical protein [Wielerella bovis]|uniref:hypothetical protein n=1 Tax=Wielerella bovis TaxID=2917790 RepID=UPI0020193073|nr:hypothetical protein [Wielerella bovis]ULJ62524.1 hypothetical protein MIS46_11385 [Wielerella bovis]ULJ64749.1 hypothetical protein MIS33_11665 [Wielerella bovis]ULJ67021.1 hypothetical protein MIS31_12555 [Wielerella bovis]